MKIQNKNKLPQTYVDLVHNLVYDPRETDPNRIGITTLIQNPRLRILKLAHYDEIEVDVSDFLWLLLGNAVHYVLAKIDSDKEKSKDRFIETKLEEQVNGLTIVGKLDLFDTATASIEDWKITSVWSIKFGDHESWEEQLNPYAWLLRKCGFEVKQARINAILRDWRKSEMQKYEDYPKVPFVTVPIKLWSFEEQQAFVEQRVEIYKEAMKMNITDLPICSEQERWKKEDSYAVYKGTNKTASRVLETAKDAEDWAKTNLVGCKYNIVKRLGVDNKCIGYCDVAHFCQYWIDTYKGTEYEK